jgi:hypothetical protein
LAAGFVAAVAPQAANAAQKTVHGGATVKPHAGTGYIELCKYAYNNNKWTEGSFNFSISGVSGTQTVQTGTCNAPVAVPAGSVTIKEQEPAPFKLAKVVTSPSYDLKSTSYSGASSVVNVPAGITVEAAFYNEPNTGLVKVCKTLASNAAALEGDAFYFDYSYSFTPSTGGAPVTGRGVVEVTAASSTGVTVCEPIGHNSPSSTSTGYYLPIGTVVSIHEDMRMSPSGISSSMTGIVPPSANDGSTSSVANLIVKAGATDAMFTNGALGYIEVCKNLWVDQDTTVGPQPFTFSIDGGPLFTVLSGSCSAPIEVAVGNHTVAESPNSTFPFWYVTTVAADDPFGERLLSNEYMNPASVSVPYGGVANETIVTFWNYVAEAQVKVCIEQTSPDANLNGATFDVKGTTSNGVAYSAVLTVTASSSNPQGEVCGYITGPFDAVNGPNNTPVTLYLTETADPTANNVPAGTDIADVIYQGNGSGPNPDTFPQPLGTTFSFTLGAGENVVTFVNGRTGADSTAGSHFIK